MIPRSSYIMRQNISSTVTANLSKMSQGTKSSLNDTIPLEKKDVRAGAIGFG